MLPATPGDQDGDGKPKDDGANPPAKPTTSPGQILHDHDRPLSGQEAEQINLRIHAVLNELAFWLGNPAALVIQRHGEEKFTVIGVGCSALIAQCMVDRAAFDGQGFGGDDE